MITKYIGAASELNNATKIALVESPELLNEAQIPQMTPDYFGNKYRLSISVTKEDGINKFKLNTVDKKFSFNAIIFYNLNDDPIGFSMLDSSIELNKYNISKLEIIPEFIITSDKSYIELSIKYTDYKTHIESTSKVHKNLFKATNNSINVKEIAKTKVKDSKYSNDLTDALLNEKIYRYSGDLSLARSKLVQSTYNLPNGVKEVTEVIKDITSDPSSDLSEFNKLLKINGTPYLIT